MNAALNIVKADEDKTKQENAEKKKEKKKQEKKDKENEGALAQIRSATDKSHFKDDHPHLFELAVTSQDSNNKDNSSGGWFSGLGSGMSGGMWDTVKTGATMMLSELMETEKMLQKDAVKDQTLAQNENAADRLSRLVGQGLTHKPLGSHLFAQQQTS